MKKFLALSVSMLLLVACSGSVSPVLPPAKLVEFDKKFTVKKLWRAKLGKGASEYYLKLQPAISKGKLFSIDSEGNYKVVSLENGAGLFSAQLDIPVSSGVAWQDEVIYAGTSKGELLAISSTRGEIIWRSQLTSEVLATPQISGNVVVARSVDGRVYGLNAQNGNRLWVYDRSVPLLTLRGNSTPVIAHDMVIVGTDSGKLAALSLQSGQVLWEKVVAVPQGRNELERLTDIDADPVVMGDVVYTVSYQGRLAALQIASGKILWARDFSSYSGMLLEGNELFISDAEGMLWSLNRFNGSTQWRQDILLRRSLTRPALHNGHIVVADFNGYLHWFSRDNGTALSRIRLNVNEFDRIMGEGGASEDDLLFSVWNNVLIEPFPSGKMLIAIDRIGNLEAFRLREETN